MASRPGHGGSSSGAHWRAIYPARAEAQPSLLHLLVSCCAVLGTMAPFLASIAQTRHFAGFPRRRSWRGGARVPFRAAWGVLGLLVGLLCLLLYGSASVLVGLLFFVPRVSRLHRTCRLPVGRRATWLWERERDHPIGRGAFSGLGFHTSCWLRHSDRRCSGRHRGLLGLSPRGGFLLELSFQRCQLGS